MSLACQRTIAAQPTVIERLEYYQDRRIGAQDQGLSKGSSCMVERAFDIDIT